MNKSAPGRSAASPRWRSSRCRASACCCSCGSPSAARCRSSRRATASRSASRRRRTLAKEADVRISGVPVGKVKDIEPDKTTGRSDVTIQLDSQYAPLPSDAKAILRQKTLLGETYVELTPGDQERQAGAGERAARRGAGLADRRARRDPPHVRPARRARRSRTGCRRRRRRSAATAQRPQRRARQPRRRSPTTPRRSSTSSTAGAAR